MLGLEAVLGNCGGRWVFKNKGLGSKAVLIGTGHDKPR